MRRTVINVLAYCRVSSDEQKKGCSLEEQERQEEEQMQRMMTKNKFDD